MLSLRFSLGLPVLLGIPLAFAAAQVQPSAQTGGAPFTVGAGASAFNPDFNKGTMLGVTFWADYQPPIFTRFTSGLSIAGEIRDLNYHRSSSQATLREDTYTAGAKYAWERYSSIRPYVRAMAGYGSITFPATGTYTHDSRTISSFSGGADVRLLQDVWVRADYEYQYWPGLFSGNLHPQGVTVGVLYDFRARRRVD